MRIHRLVMLIVAALVLGRIIADELKDREKQPTEVQHLQLEVMQKDALLAQKDMQNAQANYQQALLKLSAKAAEIKKENKWDDSVTFNPNTLAYCTYGIAADGQTCLPKKEEKKDADRESPNKTPASPKNP